MQTFRDYANVTSQIHAPKELKDKVLQAARESAGVKKPAPARRSPISFLQKAAVAAVLALSIPVTAFAATKFVGVRDQVSRWGAQDMDAVETLVNTFPIQPQEAVADPAQEYARFDVLEAICDSESIYLVASITPLSDDYLLVPDDWGIADDASLLGIEGVGGMTIKKYAESVGKEILMVGICLQTEDGELLPVGISSTHSADGTVYQYFDGSNPFDTKDFPVTVLCLYRKAGENLAQRFEYEIQMTDNSTRTPLKTFTKFEDTSDIGVTLHSLVIEKSELCIYATFTYSSTENESCPFSLMDANGNYFRPMPGGTPMARDNGDGTFSFTGAYQKIDSMENLQFQVIAGPGIHKYGPYKILG